MICAMACTPPTEAELRAAWEAMRTRRSLRGWPAAFEDVMADAWRSRCVAVEAVAARTRARRAAVASEACGTPTAWPASLQIPRRPTPSIDLKRAAAGERDED